MYGKPTQTLIFFFLSHLSNARIPDIILRLFEVASKSRIVLVSLKAFDVVCTLMQIFYVFVKAGPAVLRLINFVL